MSGGSVGDSATSRGRARRGRADGEPKRRLRSTTRCRARSSVTASVVVRSTCTHTGPSADPSDPHGCTVLVIFNVDPYNAQAGTTWLDLPALGVDPDQPFDVQDLLTGRRYRWHGPQNYVELRPDAQPGHIFRVTQG